ncbi:hypothetical protein VTL71DRAFT_10246 [Oculimacula yallundae]|uniref:DUF2470 domain-containing protein n=1 Tax=Oculimacula yallundae TaxID=86028 RepID=A0ABR4CT04_9HELO
MADTPQDEAAKARIIKHMNADHAESLSYYLQHFCKLSSRIAHGATLTSITLSSMTFKTTDGKTHTIPLNPPMKAWSEARQRSVDMDREARNGLGISSIRITEYEPPRKPVQIVLFGILILTWLAVVFQRSIVPGTWLYDTVLSVYPGGPGMFTWMIRKMSLPFIAIHVLESVFFDQLKLRKHGVVRGSPLWFKWIGSCLIEGFACFQRINETIDRKAREAEKAKH